MSDDDFDDELLEDLEELDENSSTEEYFRVGSKIGRHTEIGVEVIRKSDGQYHVRTDQTVNLTQLLNKWFG